MGKQSIGGGQRWNTSSFSTSSGADFAHVPGRVSLVCCLQSDSFTAVSSRCK